MKTLGELAVLIIGLGQMGGSLGMDLRRRALVSEVVGLDSDEAVSQEAVRLGVVDRAGDSLDAELPQVDLVVLAAPIREIPRLIPYLGQRMSEGSAILDVGSTKAEILGVASQLPPSIDFIGGHPLAGIEKSGLGAARTGAFENTTFAIVPPREGGHRWLKLIEELVTAIGARPVRLTAEEHDRLIALTSNLPYLLAIALARLVGEGVEDDSRLMDLVGGSLRSATRVAASSPELTLDMFLTNRENIARLVDGLILELRSWRGLIERGDEAELRKLIEDAKRKAEVIRHG